MFFILSGLWNFFWMISIIVAIGIYKIGELLTKKLAGLLLLLLTVVSVGTFYISYFILFQNETTEYTGASYIELNGILENYPDKKVIIDSSRDFAIGLRIAYMKKYNPKQLASSLRP